MPATRRLRSSDRGDPFRGLPDPIATQPAALRVRARLQWQLSIALSCELQGTQQLFPKRRLDVGRQGTNLQMAGIACHMPLKHAGAGLPQNRDFGKPSSRPAAVTGRSTFAFLFQMGFSRCG